ncbi:autophagy protein Apg6-domain-containing protein [Bisporella sp. PMI_857]|nr:autophagy protein Apg6-domain-containing protein [Bisporella sp. PMI_857]
MYCQKCRTPLKLDSSLEDLNPAAFDLLVGASSHQPPKNTSASRPAYPQERKQLYDRVVSNAPSPIFRRNISAVRGKDSGSESIKNVLQNPAMSFVMLTESQVVPPAIVKSPEDTNPKNRRQDDTVTSVEDAGKAMSQDMERASRLFDILTSRSDIDHPICVECTELLVEGMQKRFETASKERDAFVGLLKQVNVNVPTEEDIKESREMLEQAQKEEEAAILELERLEAEQKAVDEEIAQLEEEARELDIQEEKFWSERNDFAMKLIEFQNVRDSVNQQYDHDSQLLEKLHRTNVYNDAFCISHDGTFATINGLRLGRLSNVPVDWPEINAAWGHTVLLLATIADKLGFKFNGYELQPMGSTSRIIRYDYPSPASSSHPSRPPKKSILELYSSGDMPLGLTFMHRKFDIAMVAFLECMRQLGAFVETMKLPRELDAERSSMKLPYRIEGDKIDGLSIKLGIAQDDAWSRACKYVLTCCKFLLAHASNITNARRSGS